MLVALVIVIIIITACNFLGDMLIFNRWIFICSPYIDHMCVFASIHREGFICLHQLECQGTDQRCCVEDVSFLRQVCSSLLQNEAPSLSKQPLYPVHTLEAGRTTTQLVCVSISKHKALIYHYQASPSLRATSQTDLPLASGTHERRRKLTMKG